MIHLEEELNILKQETMNMWQLVIQQLQKTEESLINFDKDLASEVIANEKRVNAMELKIDNDCESAFALLNPVAVDLRFVLAILKINNNLERTGDIAEGIAKFIANAKNPFETKLLEVTRVREMYDISIEMLKDILIAFETENTKLARTLFRRDEIIDEINRNANTVLVDYIAQHPESTEQALNILSAIRKLERVGDQAKNIAEEIIFYVEAKVLKHMKKSKLEE
jgi:phosphate transport system protein